MMKSRKSALTKDLTDDSSEFDDFDRSFPCQLEANLKRSFLS